MFSVVTKKFMVPAVYEDLIDEEDNSFINAEALPLRYQKVGMIIIAYKHGYWQPCKFLYLKLIGCTCMK